MATMAPSTICDGIVNTIKKSNLHFLLSENAFSARITIRKKFIDETKNKVIGAAVESDVVNLKNELEQKTLESDRIQIVNFKLEEANKVLAKEITELEFDNKQVRDEKISVENEIQNYTSECQTKENSYRKAKESFENTIKVQNEEIRVLKLSNDYLKGTTTKLNKELSETRTKYKKEHLEMTKNFKQELKM